MRTVRQPRLKAPPRGKNVLWYRPSGRHKWRAVGSADWAPDALALMDGVKGGEWYLAYNGENPNEKRSK